MCLICYQTSDRTTGHLSAHAVTAGESTLNACVADEQRTTMYVTFKIDREDFASEAPCLIVLSLQSGYEALDLGRGNRGCWPLRMAIVMRQQLGVLDKERCEMAPSST